MDPDPGGQKTRGSGTLIQARLTQEVLAHELLVSWSGGSAGRLTAGGPQLSRPVGEVAGGPVLTLLVRLVVLAQHLLHAPEHHAALNIQPKYCRSGINIPDPGSEFFPFQIRIFFIQDPGSEFFSRIHKQRI